jgi:hypothetical protein
MSFLTCCCEKSNFAKIAFLEFSLSSLLRLVYLFIRFFVVVASLGLASVRRVRG